MSLYILDTDHLTLHRYGHPEVTARVHGTPAEQLALEHEAILVTRNRKDFEQVSDLPIEDWSQP